MSFWGRLRNGLKKTRSNIMGKMEGIFARNVFDDEFYEELEETLIGADVGVDATLEAVEKLREQVKENKAAKSAEVMQLLKGILLDMLTPVEAGKAPETEESRLKVILVLGVNGVGKTTTIGKLAYYYRRQGKKVLLAAGDTFRAAAIEQLEAWAKRSSAEIISHQQGGDPSAVLFDAVTAAQARKADIVLCDTAGRLHNKSNLMEELGKIGRVLGKALPGAPHEVLLVLDATTGQNALAQARLFNEAVPLTGVALTKLDGTAKGGIVIPIAHQFKVPVKYVGLGEGIEDLQPFDPGAYVDGLFPHLEECEK